MTRSAKEKIFLPKHLLRIAIAASVLAVNSAEAQPWPHAAGGTSNPQCVDAYRLAKAAFQSTNAWLFWPFDPPKDLVSRISLHRVEKDISNGDGLTSETEEFTPASASDSRNRALTILWQDQPRNGKRIAVVDQVFNWEGDWYRLYVLNAETSPDDLVKDFQTEDETKRSYKPFLESSWNPPLVLTDEKSGVSWFIDMGAPYQILADWQVSTVSEGVARSPCTISFRPNVKSMVSLMPEAAQRLAALLDSVLGSGRDEGTLHPTARIRLNVAEDWANASLRPWALVDTPYNTREEVDEGLKQWAIGSAARTAIYRDIRLQAVRAEGALAHYYQRRFTLRPMVARQMGAYVADFMYRAYFVFPRSGGNNSRESARNPWPVRLR